LMMFRCIYAFPQWTLFSVPTFQGCFFQDPYPFLYCLLLSSTGQSCSAYREWDRSRNSLPASHFFQGKENNTRWQVLYTNVPPQVPQRSPVPRRKRNLLTLLFAEYPQYLYRQALPAMKYYLFLYYPFPPPLFEVKLLKGVFL